MARLNNEIIKKNTKIKIGRTPGLRIKHLVVFNWKLHLSMKTVYNDRIHGNLNFCQLPTERRFEKSNQGMGFHI